jgi:hypothetical protein
VFIDLEEPRHAACTVSSVLFAENVYKSGFKIGIFAINCVINTQDIIFIYARAQFLCIVQRFLKLNKRKKMVVLWVVAPCSLVEVYQEA